MKSYVRITEVLDLLQKLPQGATRKLQIKSLKVTLGIWGNALIFKDPHLRDEMAKSISFRTSRSYVSVKVKMDKIARMYYAKRRSGASQPVEKEHLGE